MSLLSRSERTVRLPLLPYIFVTFSLSYPTLPSDSYLTVLFNGPIFFCSCCLIADVAIAAAIFVYKLRTTAAAAVGRVIYNVRYRMPL